MCAGRSARSQQASGAFSPGLPPERPGFNINTCAMTNASA
jgi:hypothetical protein